MTVATEANYAELAWTGVETSFTPGFKADAVNDVYVVSRDAAGVETILTRTVHYNTALAGDGAVTITPIALPAAPKTLVIFRETPAVQEIDFVNLGSFDPAVHTRLHDRAALRDAELRRRLRIAALTGTSVTSVAIGTGSKSITTQTAKLFPVGETLVLASNADPANYMRGQVTAYNAGTGALTVNVTTTGGSGAFADWLISVASVTALAPPPASQVINDSTVAGGSVKNALDTLAAADVVLAGIFAAKAYDIERIERLARHGAAFTLT